jgi:hypothetical protein
MVPQGTAGDVIFEVEVVPWKTKSSPGDVPCRPLEDDTIFLRIEDVPWKTKSSPGDVPCRPLEDDTIFFTN